MSHSFQPLIFGGDINVYSVARAFHEAYGIKSIVYGKYNTFPCDFSSIIDYRTCKENDTEAMFLQNVKNVAAECADKTVIVLGCGDAYIQLAAHLKGQFPENVLAPYIDGALLDTLINKEKFYEICDQYGVEHPLTFIHRKEMGNDFTLPFGFPCVAKPADGVVYWLHDPGTFKKAYVCQDRQELEDALNTVYTAGYPDSMILQDFIPGDDTYMRVMTNYSTQEGEVKLMCLGHVLLEEHSPHGIGNHAVIITERDEALSMNLKKMLEALHFTGFSNLDLKYDTRDGKYKVFEINCRQGRSNYYVTGAGYNIAKLLVEDRIEGKELPFVITDRVALWRTVPRKLAFDFIPKSYHAQMKELIRAGADNHPMDYAPDLSLNRRLRLMKNHVGNTVRFGKHNKRPEN